MPGLKYEKNADQCPKIRKHKKRKRRKKNHFPFKKKSQKIKKKVIIVIKKKGNYFCFSLKSCAGA